MATRTLEERRDEAVSPGAIAPPSTEGSSPLKLAPAAFHGPAGELVRLLEPHSEADPIALLTNTLVAIGNLIGPTPHMLVEGDRHPARLYVVHVGETAKARKGTAWGRIRSILELVDPTWTKNRIRGGLVSGEGVIDNVADARDGEEPTDRRLMVVEGEFASVLKIMERPGNVLSPTLRNLWDHGNAQTLAKNSPVKTTGAHVSIVGHVTRDELLRYLTATETANGFGNRFLFLRVGRSKILPFGGELERENLSPIVDRLRSAVSAARRIGRVRWSPEAADYWRSVYPQVSEGRPGMIGALVARSETQLVRLAVLYAVLDGSSRIEPNHLGAAWCVWKLAEQSVQEIFAHRTGDPLADRIGQLLRDAAEQTLTRTELRNALSRNYEAWQVDAAIDQLKRLRLVEETTQPTGGRSTTIYSWNGGGPQ